MTELRQAITVSVDANEIIPTLSWDTKRKEITREGALGVANNTGLVGLALNGKTVAHLWLHEDRDGYVVVDVYDDSKTAIGRIEVELHGHVPPRTGAKVRKERRFGDEPLGS